MKKLTKDIFIKRVKEIHKYYNFLKFPTIYYKI